MAKSSISAVAYYRMSTAQQADSIPEQRSWGSQVAEANGVSIVAEFQDDAIAGDVRDRAGLAALLGYVESRPGDVQAVVVWDGDRLSRADSIKTAVFLDRLITAGVTRLLTQEGWIDFDSDLDRLLYNIKQDMGRLAFSKSLSKNVARSGLRRAREGRWVCGRPPYGYIVGDDGHLAFGDPIKAEASRRMFREFVGTAASLGDMARRLNESGLPGPTGRRWRRDTVRDLLINPAYCGDIVWNVRTRAKHNRPVPNAAGEVKAVPRPASKQSRASRANDESDRVVVTDAHPALVDRETFAAVRRKLIASRHRRTTPRAGGGDWVLSGMLYCSDCGGRLTGSKETKSIKGRTYIYRTYGCCANIRFGAGTCYTNRVHQDALLTEIGWQIKTAFQNPTRLRQLRDEMEALAREQADDGAADRARLRGRIADLERQLDTGAERLLLCPAAVQDRAAAKLKEWEAEKEEAVRELARLAAASEAGEAFTARVGEALYSLQTLEERIASAPPEVARDTLAAVVNRVTLHFDHGQKYRGDRKPKTELREMEIEIDSGLATLLGINPTIRSLVGDWKKYAIGNRTFEEIDKMQREKP